MWFLVHTNFSSLGVNWLKQSRFYIVLLLQFSSLRLGGKCVNSVKPWSLSFNTYMYMEQTLRDTV